MPLDQLLECTSETFALQYMHHYGAHTKGLPKCVCQACLDVVETRLKNHHETVEGISCHLGVVAHHSPMM